MVESASRCLGIIIIILLSHYPTLLGQRKAQNIRRHHTAKQGRNTDGKQSNNIAALKNPNFDFFFSFPGLTINYNAANFKVHQTFFLLQSLLLISFFAHALCERYDA